MKFIIAFFFCISVQAIYSIGSYKKGDILYNCSGEEVKLYADSNTKSKIVTVLNAAEDCIVIDDNIKKTAHTVIEIKPKKDAEDDFKGFSLSGFWVKVKTKDGKTGYVFDAYLSKTKPGFELSKSYFDQEFKLMKSKAKKPDPKKDNAYSSSYIYKNGASITENGSDYDSHTTYFIPNLTLEEAYFLLKTSDRIPSSKDSGAYGISIQFDGTELSFSSISESTSIKKVDGKMGKGIEILFEAAD
ncbi:SH3 domain-containing protein [Flavobacterium sp. ANB]|uniref:SH3 domain-containing protein n=1 Tax=unclassified Flavobacterium TaxID=196869 RepID=UPI0012B7CD9B|nr:MULTISPECIES: SH3 domain-containing protein [unclassified Flavobacterium]MBF4515576.1 SH3 domain-containing protein [Flavobacterium sp. ANB]MTD68579.1 SH3 domain-containing protein [Flavobacterium sp. LC2016-13]